jgi:hypothetical protein
MVFFLVISFSTPVTVPVLYLLSINLFDILGYHFILIRRTTHLPDKETVKSYRIIQVMFDCALIVLLGISFGWIPALSGSLLKLFAVQDLLYYLFLMKKLPGTWTWLGFTPLGFLKKKLTDNEVIIQAAVGIILTTIILTYGDTNVF